MNPLNSHQTQAQFFITAMPPLAPASVNSILKTTAAQPTPTLNANQNSALLNSQRQSTNQLVDANTFITGANFLPVLLTNQTLITNVEPVQHQQQVQKVPPTLMKVTNSPVVTDPTTTNFISTNKQQQPIVMTNNPGNSITYQVLTSQQNSTLAPAVLAAQNGGVSVLLTSSAPQTLGTTSGHVAAPPSFLIRNTPTTLAGANVVAGDALAASTQINTQQQQYQQQFHQQLLSQTLNTQQLNPEILKQIVVGNTNSTSNSTSTRKTLLKSSMQQNKAGCGVQKPNNTKVNNKTIQISGQQQKQKQKLICSDTMPGQCVGNGPAKVMASDGMELQKKSTSLQKNNNSSVQTVQKLPQVSLLQNPKTKASVNCTKASSVHSNSITAVVSSNLVQSVKCNDKTTPNFPQNTNEVRVGDLNPEVSLIKKSDLNGDKTKELAPLSSLLRTNVPQEKHHQKEVSLLKAIKPSNSVQNNDAAIKSLLKVNACEKRLVGDCMKSNKALSETVGSEKQESLLKAIKKTGTRENTSPRNQRSKSNSDITQQNSIATDASLDGSRRRHSEPKELGKQTVDNINSVNQPVKLNKLDELAALDSKETSSAGVNRTTDKFGNIDVDSLNSQELDTLLEEFEDEEYLESSGEKPILIISKVDSKLSSQLEGETIKDLECITNKNENYSRVNKNLDIKDKDQVKKPNNDSESDDDVTILPIEYAPTEPIEIDDDDDDDDEDDERKTMMSVMKDGTPSSQTKEKPNELLLCDEQILISSSSSISNQSSDQISTSSSSVLAQKQATSNLVSTTTTTTASPLLKKSLTERKNASLIIKDEPISGYSTVVDMLSNYNMLNWRERIGTARGTQLKFQLNEFNLIQVHEKVPNRTKSSYEKPVYERDNLQIRTEANEPITYYMCRRCNVRASAIDFLAPEFCSLYCLRRDRRKRQQREEDNPCILRKKHRNVVTSNISNPPPLTYISQPKFRWSSYLKANFTSIAAPISLFLNPFPTGPNNFQIGMKLEAIDPENCSLFCVCTVVDTNGYRLKLSFDGYESSYDFWLNADSMDIFPPGWCTKTNRILQPPKGISGAKFNWGAYLSKEKATAAPRHLFTHLNSSSLIPRNQFEIGMHLEAEDLNDTGKLCVASIADVLDDRIRIHFDGWDDCYDIIVDINSPYIHPCGWHELRQQLVVPPDCESSTFNWEDYINKQGIGKAACDELFAPREPINFKTNMKLEVVDPRNSSLIRPATVVAHKGHRVKLHLDGWPNDYCFWLEDDSPDLHPIGWCDATGHDLEPPPGFQMSTQKMPCPITGCRGIGNAKKSYVSVHATRDSCPYAPENWRIVMEKPPRLSYEDILRTIPRHTKQQAMQQQSQQRLSDHEILERLEVLDNIKTRNMLMHPDNVTTSPKDLIGFSSLSKLKNESTNKFDETAHSASSTSSTMSACKIVNDEPIDVNLEISKHFLCDYGPRLQQSYVLWQKNFCFDVETIKYNPISWSVADVFVFVEQNLKNSKTSDLFVQEDIDGEAFLLLQQEDLTERLGLKLGPAVKLYTCILQLRTLSVTKFNVAYPKASKK